MTTKATSKEKHSRTVAQNRKAYHEYQVIETFKAGIVLTGTEIKSIRMGKVSIADGFARIENGEVFLYGTHINPYDKGTVYNHDPERTRKLLLNRQEIRKLIGKTKESGLTLIPLKLFFERCWVKVELGLCKGKKLYDKRDTIKEREGKREIERTMKRDS